ncbi:MAG: L-seryl-tRNA(Sec) selenium transferase [Gemmatimonadetes bacterium]|nr:L-seryl-tRNA(Sec) selenium transferase [Gemmatimonadota bacterium]MYK53822.1 L-seryl-tRNA(Sec) selenium transferase [Gemmatimonadota bacterium]
MNGDLKKNVDYSIIPGVDRVLNEQAIQTLSKHCGTSVLTDMIRQAIDRVRGMMRDGESVGKSREALIKWIVGDVQIQLADQLAPNLRRVVNATGVILHTNLGRAPLSDVAVKHIADIAGSYSNLELDLDTGQRGSRTTLVEKLLCELTGAEAAAIANNNAAAVLLTLNTLAGGKEAIVSRGQLVEIGGSFRIPDIMSRSGAQLVEVGTTNRTHLSDYENALTENTGVMLAVHPSNYKVMGFTAEVALEDMVVLGRQRGVPVAHDLGGGVLVNLRDYGLPYEPLVSDSISAGADVVMFSGDKVLGGPQCGIIVGKQNVVEQIRKNPLMRALRCGKLTYAALEATLKLFLNPEALAREHPTLRMLTEPVGMLERRGQKLLRMIGELEGFSCELVDSQAQTGSGALPLENIPSVAVAISGGDILSLSNALRRYDPPVICYVRGDQLFLDLRTIRDDEVSIVGDAVQKGARG